MKIKFSKYHGLGNDFIIINKLDGLDYSRLAKEICNRNTGIGADGLIVVIIDPFTMLYYNQDGSSGSMCGNGLRCFGKYVVDNKIIKSNSFLINTLAGEYNVEINTEIVKSKFPYSLDSKIMKIDTNLPKFLNELVLNTKVNAIYTGTDHLVVFIEDVNSINEEYAKALHNHKLFTKKINVNFVKVKNRSELEIKTYERGVGFTLACGTGAVASFIISRLYNYVDSKIEVNYVVGKLVIEEINGEVYASGPAEKVAEGIFYYKYNWK